eukprot:11216150-Lingulodinium_polyedra.AAC.1
MREGKLRRKLQRRVVAHNSAIAACLQAVQPFVMRSKVQLRMGRQRGADGEMLYVDVVGSGSRQLFTWETMLNMVYEKPVPKKTLAEMYNASARTIGRVITGT